MRPTSLLAALLLAVAGCGEGAPVADPEPAPTEATPAAACCSVDDVIAMHAAGVDVDILLTSIRTGPNKATPTPQDLIRLNEAGVPKPVVQALLGEEPAASDSASGAGGAAATGASASTSAAAPAASREPAGPPPLSLMVAYVPGSKALTLTNTSDRTYTGVVLTANGEYVYAMPVPLPPGNPDSVRIGSFTSPKSGHKLYPSEGIRTLQVKTQQGTWSQRF